MRSYEPNTDHIVSLYQQLEDGIITAMIRRIMRMGKVSDTTKYQAEILQQAGLLYTDIVQIIANRTDACSAAVKALFEDAGVETVDIENDIHETADQLPVNIRQSSPMRRVLEAGYRKTQKTLYNLVSTTADTTQTAFYNACDRSYMQVSSGAFSYQEAIRTAVRSLADTGAYVTYPTGHRDRIDVAVRRCTLTGVGQTSVVVSKTYAEESGCHLMELTAHSGARPEHARWQGQLVTLTGEDAGETIDGLHVYTLHEIGYGDGRGFKGWNCRHDWHAYYKGISKPNYTPEQIAKLNEKNISYNSKKYTEYEISQMQRAGERNVRALKRRTLAAQTAVENAPDEETRVALQADYEANAVKLKDAEKTLKDFCHQTGRRNDTFRSQVNGFGRSASQKAVHAAKRQQTASQTTENGTSGHAVEVTPSTPKDNGGTGKAEKIGGKTLTSGADGGIMEEEYKRFHTGEEVNDFFYYDSPEKKSLLQKRKSTYGRWKSIVTSDQESAISDYCADGYDAVNSFLRKNNGYESISEEYVKSIISDLDSAIGNFDVRENFVTYRGSSIESLLQEFPEAEDFKDLVGKTYHDNAYMSTSLIKKVAEKFATENGQEGIVFEISVPKGKGLGGYINEFSGFKDDEYEFLLKRGTFLEIYEVDESGNIPILKCRWKD